jgi:hypothetical protein
MSHVTHELYIVFQISIAEYDPYNFVTLGRLEAIIKTIYDPLLKIITA